MILSISLSLSVFSQNSLDTYLHINQLVELSAVDKRGVCEILQRPGTVHVR